MGKTATDIMAKYSLTIGEVLEQQESEIEYLREKLLDYRCELAEVEYSLSICRKHLRQWNKHFGKMLVTILKDGELEQLTASEVIDQAIYEQTEQGE